MGYRMVRSAIQTAPHRRPHSRSRSLRFSPVSSTNTHDIFRNVAHKPKKQDKKNLTIPPAQSNIKVTAISSKEKKRDLINAIHLYRGSSRPSLSCALSGPPSGHRNTSVRPLTPEDMMVQSSSEASPVKWHSAHSSWFFETFVLSEFLAGYQPFNPDFRWLFNSYYNTLGDMPEKKLRASFSRPPLESPSSPIANTSTPAWAASCKKQYR